MDKYYAYIGIPIRVKGKLLGIMSILGENFDQLTIEHITLLTAIGSQIGDAIEGAHLRSKAEEAAVIEERQRLARELHDSVTQYLYSLTLLSKGWQREIGSTLLDEVKEWLEQVGDISSKALKEMRLLLYALHPQTMLDREGLVGAIKRNLDNLEEKFNIKTKFITDIELDLSPRIEHELYRIVQESLNNVIKHSNATELAVSLRQARDYIELEISDNGIGFSPDVLRVGKGLGIALMRERASSLGTTISLESNPGKGTRVTVRVNPNQYELQESSEVFKIT